MRLCALFLSCHYTPTFPVTGKSSESPKLLRKYRFKEKSGRCFLVICLNTVLLLQLFFFFFLILFIESWKLEGTHKHH